MITKRTAIYLISIILLIAACTQPQHQIQYATKHFQLTLSGDGQIARFVDLRSGINYADTADTKFCVLRLQKSDVGVASDKVLKKGDMLTFSFPGTPITVKLKVKVEKSYLVFDVADISGGDFYSLQFARVPLKIDYDRDDFAACAMSRKINTRTLDYPGKSNLLGGHCFKALGYEDAGVFLLGMPEAQMRETMKRVVDAYPPGEMPVSRAGGPYAMDDPKNYGSYAITTEAITEAQVDEWAARLSAFGINQIYFHQGTPFRHADFVFNKTAYPNGISDFRKVSEAFRRHGIATGILTYDKLIPGDSKYITPVPSKDLDVMRTFTLAADLGTDDRTVAVEESTADVSGITGYFVRNSMVIRIDDELIVFGNPSSSSPYGFTSCQRGAYGTKVATHAKGASVEHLTQFYHYFAPKNGSELFYEIARETARAYNEGGFELLYFDASDASFELADDQELSWYYEALFVNEILKYTETPPSIEYCWLSNLIWYGVSRVITLDAGTRGHRRFFDLHIHANLFTADRLYLPGQMGWTSLCPSRGDNTDHFQYHILFREDVEYLGAKMIAYNYGASYLDFIQANNAQPFSYRNGAILKNYDLLRRSGHFTAETVRRLHDPDANFMLCNSGDDWYLTEANLAYVLLRPDTREFTYRNPYHEQTPMIRIEHRHRPAAYESAAGIDLLPFDETQPAQSETIRAFDPPVDLSKHLGLGLWVYGDGGGQRIRIRMKSPFHIISGFVDRKLTADFTGWRYFALAEADNGMTDEVASTPLDFYDHLFYEEFRQTVHFNSISEISLHVTGDASGLRFRTVRALPLTETYLVDPALEYGGRKITFRGKIKNGHYMEYEPGGRAVVYDALGNEVSEMQPDTPSFRFPAGESALRFSGADQQGKPASVRITLRTNDVKALR